MQPWWSERQQEKEQSKLLAHWDQWHDSEQNTGVAVPLPPARSRAAPTNLSASASASATAPDSASASDRALASAPDRESDRESEPGTVLAPASAPNPEPTAESKPAPKLTSAPSRGPAVIDGQVVQGTIEIDSIGLREPILEGATDETLRYGIGTVVSKRQPGITGNYVLAGHNSRTSGKHFNRIHELKEGDHIVITTEHGVYDYAVASQSIVEPTDLSVLDQTESATELTLITCDQIVNPKHRLIVRAVLDSRQPA
jgi:sortase A